MAWLNDLVDGVAVWLDFNLGSGGVIFLVVAGVGLVSGCAALATVMAVKQRATIELAHYGGGMRSLKSFVCKVCLHRSYAESHIRRRYCARCDRTFPEALKVWNFQEIAPREHPAAPQSAQYRKPATCDAADHRRKTRA